MSVMLALLTVVDLGKGVSDLATGQQPVAVVVSPLLLLLSFVRNLVQHYSTLCVNSPKYLVPVDLYRLKRDAWSY